MKKEIIEHNLTLYKLLKDDVAVPDYQRDYAQGRQNDVKIEDTRIKFVDDIIQAASSTSILDCIHMGLVYGSCNNSLSGFVAVDGQQRLTTAFLFHLYLAKRISSEDSTNMVSRLKNFGWHGRIYASEFTEFLFDTKCWNGECNIISILKKSTDYCEIWETDPTVNNMFVMLNVIHSKLSKYTTDSLSKMISNLMSDNCQLVFDRMILEPDTDEFQYQMMNSRGRDLTTYELFKQKFQTPAKFPNSLKTLMDNKWLEFFDQYASNTDSEYKYEADIYFQNYINECALLMGHLIQGEKYEYSDSITGSKANKERADVNFVKYDAYNHLNKHLIFFELATNWFINNFKSAELIVKEIMFKQAAETFTSIFENNVTWHARAMFYALINYGYRLNKFTESLDIVKFKAWWRPIYNLIKGSDIGAGNYHNVMVSINKLPIDGSIYTRLSNKVDDLEFNQYQRGEEQRKANWILKNEWLANKFAEQERRVRFSGQIALLLPDECEIITPEKWETIVFSFDELTHNKYDEKNVDYEFVRTMFSFSQEGCSDNLNLSSFRYRKGHLMGGKIPARWIHSMLFDYIEWCQNNNNKEPSNYFRVRQSFWVREYENYSYLDKVKNFWIYKINTSDDCKRYFQSSRDGKLCYKEENLWLYRQCNRHKDDLLLSNRREQILSLLFKKKCVTVIDHDCVVSHPNYTFLKIVFKPMAIQLGIPKNTEIKEPSSLPNGMWSDGDNKALKWCDWGVCNNFMGKEEQSFEQYIYGLGQMLNESCRDFLEVLGLISKGEYQPIQFDVDL